MPNVHGAPVHMGDPKEVGVDDVMKPDYGEAVDIYEGNSCVLAMRRNSAGSN